MKILLVDDDQGYLNVLGDILRQEGHEVLVAENGKQARENIEFEPVDLIISDVFMPTLDGARFHSYVREFTDAHDVPFVFVSGHDDETTRRLIIDPEKDYFFSKTTPIDTLVNFISGLKRRERSSPR